jgi:hypothetical protein
VKVAATRLTRTKIENIIPATRGDPRQVAGFRSEPWPASSRNGWPASYWNAWPASSESARLMGIPPTDLKGLSLLDIFKLRKASGQLTGDPDEEFRAVVSDLQDGRPSTRIVEAEPGRWIRVSQQPMEGGAGFRLSKTSVNGAGRKRSSCIWSVTTH